MVIPRRVHIPGFFREFSGPSCSLYSIPFRQSAGDIESAILDYAKENAADLIVMGTHGRSGVPHFLVGSVAERVVRVAPCPVLTVPSRRQSLAFADQHHAWLHYPDASVLIK